MQNALCQALAMPHSLFVRRILGRNQRISRKASLLLRLNAPKFSSFMIYKTPQNLTTLIPKASGCPKRVALPKQGHSLHF
jgi:hypothetical protein